MRFIVDLYRYLILLFCAGVLIALTLGILIVTGNHQLFATWGPVTIISVAVALVMLIVSLGGIATLISIHDRHAEGVEQLRRIADRFDKTGVGK